jgi:hypothetical protein
MYNLLQQYEFSVPSEHLVLHEDLRDKQVEYRKEVDAAQLYKELKMSEMVAAVEANIFKMQDVVAAVGHSLGDAAFIEVRLLDEIRRDMM